MSATNLGSSGKSACDVFFTTDTVTRSTNSLRISFQYGRGLNGSCSPMTCSSGTPPQAQMGRKAVLLTAAYSIFEVAGYHPSSHTLAS